MKQKNSLHDLLTVMARLRAPDGCPWDREQTHRTLRHHAVEEVYELMDAIEAGDDHEMLEELGDLLLQVVFHCQLARERSAFDFDQVCRVLVDKLIRRHPHVFGDVKVKNVDQVWANWEQIKRAEKQGTKHDRPSALDGIPKHLPALQRAEKLVKKARKAGLIAEKTIARGKSNSSVARARNRSTSRIQFGRELFEVVQRCQSNGWSAEELLRAEVKRRERGFRKMERAASRSAG